MDGGKDGMKKLNILVVEDGQSQREMLRDFLRKEGHSVGEAENGERALQRVREGHYDLILLDYRMPGIDGMQVLHAALRGSIPRSTSSSSLPKEPSIWLFTR